ncbi:MAG: hypothetical protein JNK38_02425 [Acidobacteria bacterium]|nr:hypothetical protein [Acidobacteriota bacterium]
MLNHAEHCPPCRAEMASRRNLRESLRRACSQDRMSDEACERLRARLRTEAAASRSKRQPNQWLNLFEFRFAIPMAATIAILILAIVGVSSYLRTKNPSVDSSDSLALSEALVNEAASDHNKCASKFLLATKTAAMPDTVEPDYVGLEKVAAVGAEGLRLHAAHVCAPDGRRFAHLVYTRDKALISLLVTNRDERALKVGNLPSANDNLEGFQETNREHLSLGAFQTAKHIILVVSDLPKPENNQLALTLALPVVKHFRQKDGQSIAGLPDFLFRNDDTILITQLKKEGGWR